MYVVWTPDILVWKLLLRFQIGWLLRKLVDLKMEKHDFRFQFGMLINEIYRLPSLGYEGALGDNSLESEIRSESSLSSGIGAAGCREIVLLGGICARGWLLSTMGMVPITIGNSIVKSLCVPNNRPMTYNRMKFIQINLTNWINCKNRSNPYWIFNLNNMARCFLRWGYGWNNDISTQSSFTVQFTAPCCVAFNQNHSLKLRIRAIRMFAVTDLLRKRKILMKIFREWGHSKRPKKFLYVMLTLISWTTKSRTGWVLLLFTIIFRLTVWPGVYPPTGAWTIMSNGFDSQQHNKEHG